MNRSKLPYCWDRWVKEGEMLFKYMLHDLSALLDSDSKIKHFDVWPGSHSLLKNAAALVAIEEIKKNYIVELQRDLVPWIKQQVRCMDLFFSNNWRPFANPKYVALMFLGFRKLFVWDKYYFQLILMTHCEKTDICEHCKLNGSSVHFALALCGWKVVGSTLVQPENTWSLLPDNFIPNEVWRRFN